MTSDLTSTSNPPSLVHRTGHPVLDLLDHARLCLVEAAAASTANQRYAGAHLAALRTAAAVLAARAEVSAQRVDPPAVTSVSRVHPRSLPPKRRRRGPCNAWVLLAEIAPDLSEWAAFFAAGAGKRAAAEAGIPRSVTSREADDLLRDSDEFLRLVSQRLGLPHQESFVRVVPLCV